MCMCRYNIHAAWKRYRIVQQHLENALSMVHTAWWPRRSKRASAASGGALVGLRRLLQQQAQHVQRSSRHPRARAEEGRNARPPQRLLILRQPGEAPGSTAERPSSSGSARCTAPCQTKHGSGQPAGKQPRKAKQGKAGARGPGAQGAPLAAAGRSWAWRACLGMMPPHTTSTWPMPCCCSSSSSSGTRVLCPAAWLDTPTMCTSARREGVWGFGGGHNALCLPPGLHKCKCVIKRTPGAKRPKAPDWRLACVHRVLRHLPGRHEQRADVDVKPQVRQPGRHSWGGGQGRGMGFYLGCGGGWVSGLCVCERERAS
jgi:hypothetical protein